MEELHELDELHAGRVLFAGRYGEDVGNPDHSKFHGQTEPLDQLGQDSASLH